jgi:hypothetical protein
MRPSRDEIVMVLQRSAQASTPTLDPVFVEQLERRLRSIDLTPVTRARRRLGRAAVMGIVGALGLAGAAAAAAGVVAWRDSPNPAPTTTVVPTTAAATSTTSPAPTTIAPSTSTTPPTTLVVIPVATTLAPATTVAATTPTTEVTTTTEPPATTTTEVHTPATLTLSCAPVDGGVSCTWDGGPDGTARYALLRSEPGGANGRAFTTDLATTTFVDTQAVPGITYNYLVHALDASDHSLAHSGFVTVTVP